VENLSVPTGEEKPLALTDGAGAEKLRMRRGSNSDADGGGRIGGGGAVGGGGAHSDGGGICGGGGAHGGGGGGGGERVGNTRAGWRGVAACVGSEAGEVEAIL
jgi:hypothetical protein